MAETLLKEDQFEMEEFTDVQEVLDEAVLTLIEYE